MTPDDAEEFVRQSRDQNQILSWAQTSSRQINAFYCTMMEVDEVQRSLVKGNIGCCGRHGICFLA